MGQIEDKLTRLGESLPEPKEPVANYVGCKRSGNTLYVSGRVSPIRGEVGSDLTVAEARLAAKGALLDILAIIKAEIGDLDRIAAAVRGCRAAGYDSKNGAGMTPTKWRSSQAMNRVLLDQNCNMAA